MNSKRADQTLQFSCSMAAGTHIYGHQRIKSMLEVSTANCDNELVNYSPTHLSFYPLSRKEFTDATITINSRGGEPAPLVFGPVVVELVIRERETTHLQLKFVMIYPKHPQQGAGIGNIFKSLIRSVQSYFSQFIKSDFAKNLGTIGTSQATKFASDILQGESVKSSAKKRAAETLDRIKQGKGKKSKMATTKTKKAGGSQKRTTRSKSRKPPAKKPEGRGHSSTKKGKTTRKGRGKNKQLVKRKINEHLAK